MKIAICTPSVTGDVTYHYLFAVRALEAAFRAEGIISALYIVENSFLPYARNGLASVVLNDTSFTHLLFIDADISFQPDAVMKLIGSKHQVSGCVYPFRSMQIDRFHQASRRTDSPELAQSAASGFVATGLLQKRRNQQGQFRYDVQDGFIRTLLLGMGLTLIHRSAFELIAQKMPELLVTRTDAHHYQSMQLGGPALMCFTPLVHDGIDLSEDVSFCRRWSECGGEMWALVDQPISHHGKHSFRGRFADWIEFVEREA